MAASFADSVFFCNSGAEANEGMIKAVRKYHAENGHPERFGMICFEGAFHGRTLAMLAATGNEKYLAGFGPVVEGFDPCALRQHERGARRHHAADRGHHDRADPGRGRRAPRADCASCANCAQVCDEYGLLLALDEVQTGMGRSGKLWAHQWAGIEPDVMSAAKGIGGGFPLGAILAKEKVAKHLKPGTHGTTYGGGPLACAAGQSRCWTWCMAPGFLDQVDRVARHLWRGLLDLARAPPAA